MAWPNGPSACSMTNDASGRLTELAARLHSPETPAEALPVRGYRPASGSWRPRLAAVLIPVIEYPEAGVVLTVRSRALAMHAGQVAFPGGGRQGDEPFPFHTALRETREEIGLRPGELKVIGLLDRFDTITGFRVTPVVAHVPGRPRLAPCPDEVEAIFTVPWHVVTDPGSYRRHKVVRRQRRFEVVSMVHPRHLIWGATAAILQQFCQLANQRD